MKNVILDCAKMTNHGALHDEISEKLGAPDYYGRNLDALYDILTELDKTTITLENFEAMAENLGDYADLVLAVLKDAAEYNGNITLNII